MLNPDSAVQSFRRPRYQQLALWLAIAAVLLRALIPDGFMPEHRAGQRGLVLAFCSAGPLAALRAQPAFVAASELAHAPDGDPGHHPMEDHAGCAFASAAAPGVPVTFVSMSWALHEGAAVAGWLRHATIPAAAHIRPPSRAPPRYS
ncbi:MAG: hypothetical protein ACHQIO_01575 [Nevskiales bacterium]